MLSWFRKNKKQTFREKFTLEERKEQSRKLQTKFPNHVFVIVSQDLFENDEEKKNKFIISKTQTVAEFLSQFRKHHSLKDDEAVFVFTERGTLPSNTQDMESLFANNRNEDGFLYLSVSKENTFGHKQK